MGNEDDVVASGTQMTNIGLEKKPDPDPHTDDTNANAPPTEAIRGYENVGTDDTTVVTAPKSDDKSLLEFNGPRTEFQTVPIVTEDEAKEALLEFVNSKCCYGTKPTQVMVFKDIQSSNSYRYLLQTFYESRSTQWVHEPYHGQPILNNGGPPPQPWDVPVQPKELFKKEEVKTEIPNTSYVKVCNRCDGSCFNRCTSCYGSGRRSCTSCNGSGRVYTHDSNGSRSRSCTWCRGSGSSSCWSCNGSGRTRCDRCQGSGRLKWFIQLTVTFDIETNDFIKKSEDVTDEKLRKCQAVSTFSEQNPRVFGITHHHDADVNKASGDLLQLHLNKLQIGRILMQTHSVFAIPVTLCKYSFREKDYQYQIYGLDKQINAPDYPHKCCCCCSIM